jgi:glycosyltransferase involved in cell wall biosynthesis
LSVRRSDEKVRVTIVAPAPLDDPRSGGIASFIRGFIRFMPADFAVDVVGAAVGNEQSEAGWHELDVAGRSVRFFPAVRMASGRRTGRVPAKLRIVAGSLRNRRAIPTRGHVVQVHSPGMEIGLAGRNVPVIRVVHNDPADLARDTGESAWARARGVLRIVEDFTYRNAAAVYFVSRETLDQYRDRVHDAARLHYLPNGVDTDVFHPLLGRLRQQARLELGAGLGLDPNCPWLLYVGRLDEQKDPLLLIDAFAEYRLRPGARPVQLVVVGDGRLRARAEESAARHGLDSNVRFAGALARERVADVMAVSDALVMSSAFEASPFVVVEALASGLGIAATAVGEIPSVVADGVSGRIATERTPAALADAIAWVLDQPRDEMRERCVSAAQPYELRSLLEPFYAEHRRLAALTSAAQ